MSNCTLLAITSFPRKLISGALLLLAILQLTSCEKRSTEPGGRSLQVWLHRVNTISKALHFQYFYEGFELDVRYDTTIHTFWVRHDPIDTSTLTFPAWMAAITNPSRLGYWLDFKNLDSQNREKALAELLRIRQEYGLDKKVIVVESSSPGDLASFSILNFRTSYYIPTFGADTLTLQEETNYRDFIDHAIQGTGIGTISGYSSQQNFMQKYYPGLNKLLWYLDSTNPALRDSVITAVRKDPTVEVLLVAEDF